MDESKKIDYKKMLFWVLSISMLVPFLLIIIFFSIKLYEGNDTLKNLEALLNESILSKEPNNPRNVESTNKKEPNNPRNVESTNKMDLEQQVINYQFALSYYEYNNNLALHRTAMMLGAIMFYIGFIHILFIVIMKDFKPDDYFAVKAILNVSLPGLFLAFLGALIITLTLIFTPNLDHDYSPTFLNGQAQNEFYKFNSLYLNAITNQTVDSISVQN